MQRKWLAMAGGLLLYSSMVLAQPRLPQNYYFTKMDNGLEVVVIENSKVPLATIEMAVRNGAYTEGPEYSGLSHLFEHMFFKANRDYPDQERFIRRTEELGMIWNGTTSVERVNYFFTFDSDSLEAGLKFMNAAIRFPIYRTEDMQKERPVVDGEFQRAESNPFFLLWHDIQKRVWGEHATRKIPIGDHDVINTATPEKMMIIKDKYYHPNNSVIVIAGDVKHDAVFAQVKTVFGDWKHSGFDPHEKYPIPDFKPIEKNDYFVKESSLAPTPVMMFQWIGPDTRTDSLNTIVADVFNTVIGLNSSKFNQALIDKGLATYAGWSYQTTRYTGSLSCALLANPAKLEDCYKAVTDQIAQLGQNDYFTEEMLETAKAQIRRNHIRANEKPSSLSMQLTNFWASSSYDYFTDYIDATQKVTLQQLQDYANKYVVNKNHVAGIIINKEMNEQLKPATFFKK